MWGPLNDQICEGIEATAINEMQRLIAARHAREKGGRTWALVAAQAHLDLCRLPFAVHRPTGGKQRNDASSDNKWTTAVVYGPSGNGGKREGEGGEPTGQSGASPPSCCRTRRLGAGRRPEGSSLALPFRRWTPADARGYNGHKSSPADISHGREGSTRSWTLGPKGAAFPFHGHNFGRTKGGAICIAACAKGHVGQMCVWQLGQCWVEVLLPSSALAS